MDNILNEPIKFGLMSKILPTKGNMAWEYNPFRNYRLTEPKYYFRNKYWSKEDLGNELGTEIKDTDTSWSDYKQSKDLPNGIKDTETNPIFYDAGDLIDFETDELNFDINHPVDILPQWSYDGSVNLIINDGKNVPRLINSRFSPLGANTYQIVDRKGNNDTNIYDQGSQFDSDTALYKTYNGIPEIEFLNVYQNGNLPVGNYHFYFRYADADGNETDFVGESGLVSIFKGNQLNCINSGFRNENSYKSVKFIISDIDPAYSYVNVYYTRSSSDIDENATVEAYKIDQKFLVNNSLMCHVFITGSETKTKITVDEINPVYQIAQHVQTQESCQNMLFFGNIEDHLVDYKELTDLSLRFVATPDSSKEYDIVSHDYNHVTKNTYSDPAFIYKYTGYQQHELYRFGVVYLMSNGTLSPVFNIRGMYFNGSQEYSTIPIEKDNERNYITSNEDTGIIYVGENQKEASNLENVYGVVRIHTDGDELRHVIGIKIEPKCGDGEDLFNELRKYNVKGYFFVRQKRMPLRLCQAYTIGSDRISNIPLLYTDDKYVAESFLSSDKTLTHDVDERFNYVDKSDVTKYCAICPEYDVNSPYYNTLFCGDEYVVEQASAQIGLSQDALEHRHFYTDAIVSNQSGTTYRTKIVGVEDNVKLIEVGGNMFSARAGEAEEAFRYEYLNDENKDTNATNLIRGSYGPYIAFDGYKIPGTLVNIYIKDYQTMTSQELFKIRYSDKSAYYAISDRYDIQKTYDSYLLYRGDSYICTFTHRLNRNFQDPESPTNDKIVDENCWKDHYKVTDGVVDTSKFENINLGDVNAIKLGLWVTFPLVSSSNLNIRSLNSSVVDEVSLTGHPRIFYPYAGMSASGSYKIPEALCFNKGFNKSLSERYNFETPDVPAIKNDYTNRIAYSDIYVNDAFKNGFRTFKGSHYRDYPKTYGQITKLVELRGNLICVFEHGIALISVNERAIAGESTSGNIYINTSNVLPENPKIISDTFGSQWKDSIIKTPYGIYGVDTIGKKIWRTNGDTFECISDFQIQEFLNNNISLSEREITPIIGIRNVKTHYNKFKSDVMFTFYDNLYGFEEKAWNVCYNEVMQKWITFYSWIPSCSENIYNQYFSFNRETSKFIAKLGLCKEGSQFADGVTLDENQIPNEAKPTNGLYKIGKLGLANRTLPKGKDITCKISYELVRDSLGNCEKFKVEQEGDGNWYLYSTVPAVNLCSELYQRVVNATILDDLSNSDNLDTWKEECVLNGKSKIATKDSKKLYLKNPLNANTLVYLLNIKANITVEYKDTEPSVVEAYQNNISVNAGYYQSVVAVIPKYNLQFLSTNFWKHGRAGIIDMAEKIYPCNWYGKQHPFEFEFVVADEPQSHKIFDNLEIISNSAEPESFHYEIVGDCYDFAKDKQNMFIRQEATKELYQYNGSDIEYDSKYKELDAKHRPIPNSSNYDRSTILPLYYSRTNSINDIEDYYHNKTDKTETKDFAALSGGEVTYYDTLKEFRIWNHAKAVPITDEAKGRLRGNMHYQEDKWKVQINPLNIVQKNEPKWGTEDITGATGLDSAKIPIELGQSPIPNEVLESIARKGTNIPDNSSDRAIVQWKWNESEMREAKIKDKWIKIRVRYSGEKLAVISAIITLYSISYS